MKKKVRCKFPECRIMATHRWALLPLCEAHHETIRWESVKYYTKPRPNTEQTMRPNYMKISKQIPWSKERLGTLNEE